MTIEIKPIFIYSFFTGKDLFKMSNVFVNFVVVLDYIGTKTNYVFDLEWECQLIIAVFKKTKMKPH